MGTMEQLLFAFLGFTTRRIGLGFPLALLRGLFAVEPMSHRIRSPDELYYNIRNLGTRFSISNFERSVLGWLAGCVWVRMSFNHEDTGYTNADFATKAALSAFFDLYIFLCTISDFCDSFKSSHRCS